MQSETEFSDLSKTTDPFEGAIVLRAINTERNNLVKWYAFRDDPMATRPQRPLFYSDKPWTIEEAFEEQLIALNQFEARLRGCECCYNNADDFEHYHSEVCSPDYVEA